MVKIPTRFGATHVVTFGLQDVPPLVLLLISSHEVIYNPAKAMARAQALIPDFEGELVPGHLRKACIRRWLV